MTDQQPISRWTRRESIGALISGVGAFTLSTWPHPVRARVTPTELARFKPRGPVPLYFDVMRPVLFDPAAARRYLNALWTRYQNRGELYDGERTLMGFFMNWRVHDDEAQRLKVARAAQKIADRVARDHPEHPAGYTWGAIFFGAEALSRGLLESAHVAPEVENRLEHAVKLDEGYIYGLALLVLAKMYTKAPPFPVSVGNIDKGDAYFERARPYAEGKFAVWYIFKAEAAYLRHGREAAFEVLDRMRQEVEPVNVISAYALDSMLSDAKAFRSAVQDGTYHKFTWDPLLTVAKPALERPP